MPFAGTYIGAKAAKYARHLYEGTRSRVASLRLADVDDFIEGDFIERTNYATAKGPVNERGRTEARVSLLRFRDMR